LTIDPIAVAMAHRQRVVVGARPKEKTIALTGMNLTGIALTGMNLTIDPIAVAMAHRQRVVVGARPKEKTIALTAMNLTGMHLTRMNLTRMHLTIDLIAVAMVHRQRVVAGVRPIGKTIALTAKILTAMNLMTNLTLIVNHPLAVDQSMKIEVGMTGHKDETSRNQATVTSLIACIATIRMVTVSFQPMNFRRVRSD